MSPQVSWTRQLALAVTLFVLGSFAYWLEFKQKPKLDQAEEQAKKILAIKDNSIQSLKLVNGDKSIEMKCLDFEAKLCKPGDNSKWEIQSPLKLKADNANANSLLSSINNLNVTETIDLKDETPEKRAALLKEYGLDAEARKSSTRKLYMRTAEGEKVLHLGQAHPIGENIFGILEQGGKADEAKVYLIPNYFKSNLEHDLTHWRDKKMITLAAHEVTSFSLETPKAKISGEKKDGQWTIHTKKEDYAGDIENIDALLTSANYLTAKDFASDDKKDAKSKAALKGTKPVVTLTMQKDKGEKDKEAPAPIVLSLFQKGQVQEKIEKDKRAAPVPDGKLYATVSDLDPLFELDGYSKGRLDKELKDLRLQKLITSMERFGAKKLEFSGKPIGTSALTLASADGKWTLQPEKTEVSNDKIQNLLDKISGNRIKEFVQGSAIPKGESDGLQLTLGDEKTAEKRKILFWKSGDKLYAKDLQSNRKEAFLVDNVIRDALPWDRAFFSGKTEAAAAQATTPGSTRK